MTSSDRHAEAPDSDNRAVLLFIFWPIVLFAIGLGMFILYLLLAVDMGESSNLPLYLVLALGLGGLCALPALVRSTRRAFQGRGFRGFRRGAKDTNWGDGGIGETGP